MKDKKEDAERKIRGIGKLNIIDKEEKNIEINDELKENDLSKEYLSENQKSYKVSKFANNCEEHNQISYILPLARTTPKFILFIILNIFTVGIINLFVAWFPKLILYIYFSVCDLNTATHFGIFWKFFGHGMCKIGQK